MKTKIRYEPPLLVDMRGQSLAGEFITCGSGGGPSAGNSCHEDTSCMTGRNAERCQSGNQACGCDACCETGTDWSTWSGFPFTGCECIWGNQAKENCNDGQYTGGVCVNGYTAGYSNCVSGTSVYAGYGTQWCGSGTE